MTSPPAHITIQRRFFGAFVAMMAVGAAQNVAFFGASSDGIVTLFEAALSGAMGPFYSVRAHVNLGPAWILAALFLGGGLFATSFAVNDRKRWERGLVMTVATIFSGALWGFCGLVVFGMLAT